MSNKFSIKGVYYQYWDCCIEDNTNYQTRTSFTGRALIKNNKLSGMLIERDDLESSIIGEVIADENGTKISFIKVYKPKTEKDKKEYCYPVKYELIKDGTDIVGFYKAVWNFHDNKDRTKEIIDEFRRFEETKKFTGARSVDFLFGGAYYVPSIGIAEFEFISSLLV